MNNFDENQNVEVSQVDEFSTIFSDPKAHKITAEKRRGANKKRIVSIIAGVLVLAIMGGSIWAVIKYMPKLKNEEVNQQIEQMPQISLLNLAEKDFKKVTVKNKNGTFVMNNKVTVDDSGYDVCTWTLEGYDPDVISDYSLYNAASVMMKLSAMREITTRTAEECGFNTPNVEVEIVKQDDSQVKILVGDKSLDGTGVYIKFAEEDKIYLASNDIETRLTFTVLDLANAYSIDPITLENTGNYVSDGTITTFDSITVSGKNFPKDVVIKPNPDALTVSLHNFVLTAPTNRMAENVDKALAVFNSTTDVSGAYSLDAKTETIKKFGLDKPDLTITAKFGKETFTFKFKQQEDGDYAVWYTGCKMIKKVANGSLEVLNYSTSNFYSTWVYLQSIDDLSGFIVKSEGKEYKFDIDVKKSEDAATQYTIHYGKKKLTARNFQDFYRYCISLYACDFATSSITTEPEFEITYIYSDKSRKPTKITFQRSGATKYQFSIDGVAIGNVNASDVNRIATYVKQAANDEKVNII